MQAMNRFRLATLKAKARHHYRSYMAIIDRYSCGSMLAHHINPDLDRHVAGFNEAMDQLTGLDPDTPSTRLP